MKKIKFNHENAIKVVTGIAKGLVQESNEDILRSKTNGEDIDPVLYGMTKAATAFTDIFTNADDLYAAINFLASQGITIE